MTVYKRYMPGTKEELSPNWQIEFEVNGHRVRRSSGTTHKRKAQDLERKWRRELHDEKVMGKTVDMSFGEATDKYFDTVIKPKENANSAKRDLYVINALRKEFGEDTNLTSIKNSDIADYKATLYKAGRKPATVNRHLAVVKAILNKSKTEWSALAVLPTIKLDKLDNERKRWLSPEEEQRLLEASAPHLRDLIIFLLDTGARKGEALNLTWQNVKLSNSPRPVVHFLKTKNFSARKIPLTMRVEEMFVRLKKDAPEDEKRVFLYRPHGRGGKAEKPGAPRPFNHPNVTFNSACKRANIEDVVMHDLRHTFASRLVERGVHLITVKELLGHKSIKMTMRYAHLAPGDGERAIAVLDQE